MRCTVDVTDQLAGNGEGEGYISQGAGKAEGLRTPGCGPHPSHPSALLPGCPGSLADKQCIVLQARRAWESV